MKIDLKELRTANTLTQNDLAKGLGVSRITIHNWENEKVKITAKNLKKIIQFCELHKIEIGDFLSYEKL